MQDNAISILIPTRDMNHHVRGLLHNIAGQIRQGDEVLILFDGTPVDEATRQLLGRYPFVQAFNTEKNHGVATARNLLIQKAKNKILRFQDADDLLAPYSLEMARESIAGLSEWHVVVGGQLMYHDHKFVRLVNQDLQQRVTMLKQQNTLVVNMCYVNRESVIAAGGFDPKLSFEEDWDLWLRMLRKFGNKAFIVTPHIFGIYNGYDSEIPNKRRGMQVDGMHVRDYIRRKNNLTVT